MMGPGTPHYSEGLSPASAVSRNAPLRLPLLLLLSRSSDSLSPRYTIMRDHSDEVDGRRGRRPPAVPATDGDDSARRASRPARVRRSLGDVAAVLVGTVTALHERRAGSSRYVVVIDGKPAATVSSEVIAALGLRVGVPIDAPLSESLRTASGHLEVFDKAVALLAVHARSERDLRLRLRRAGAGEAGVSAAVERLVALGLLNDEAYARSLAHSRVVGGGVSKRRIAQELQRRGVSRAVADEAIDATLDDVELDEFGAAQAAAEKRLRSLRSLDAETRRRRLYAFLARRGYPHDVITKVLRTVL